MAGDYYASDHVRHGSDLISLIQSREELLLKDLARPAPGVSRYDLYLQRNYHDTCISRHLLGLDLRPFRLG
jgi:hypothetical protein